MKNYEARYTKKPVTISAVQFDGTDEHLVNTLLPFTNYLVRGTSEQCFVYDRLHDSWIEFKKGDYIIRGTQGEHYPVAVEVFDNIYVPEAVDFQNLFDSKP